MEEKTPGTGEGWHEMSADKENPPFMTVNIHPDTFVCAPKPEVDARLPLAGAWEAVDERR